jgi:hypothetical protein
MAKKLYGVFTPSDKHPSRNKFGLTHSKKEALDYVKKHGGEVRWINDGPEYLSFDAPTFYAISRPLSGSKAKSKSNVRNNPEATIKISKTYQVVTPESAEDGDFADSGVEGEDQVTFRELIDIIRGGEPSSYPVTPANINRHTWVTIQGGTDYRTGAETTYGIHFKDTKAKEKYWVKALLTVFGRR